MIIGVSYGGTDYPLNLTYYTENINYSVPIQNSPIQIITPYYYIYHFQVLINMINIALASCHANFFSSLTTFLPPYFTLDPITNLLNLIVDQNYTGTLTGSVTSQPFIFMNEALYNYLFSFPTYFLGNNQINGKEYIFNLNNVSPHGTVTPPIKVYTKNNQIYNYNYGTLTPPSPQPVYYQITQEYSIFQYWCSLRRIVITCGNIPINQEYVSILRDPGSNASFPILTDFIPPLDQNFDSRSIAYYVPPGQYRLIDMNSNDSLQHIDMRILWVDTNDNVYPLELPIFQKASVKLAFFKKCLYTPMSNLLRS
jgi:hypothetical protein